LLALFLKFPVVGKVKTRLGKDIGMDNACRIYSSIIRNLVKELNEFRPAVFSADEKYVPNFKRFFPGVCVYSQQGDNLGERLCTAFSFGLSSNEKMLIIGGDTPDVLRSDITAAYSALDYCDCVLGPCFDGGYYLIGLKKNNFRIFEDISWSSEFVVLQTLQRLDEIGYKVSLLDKKRDIDTLSDLKKSGLLFDFSV
jgi:rSAM/selenodomain-associated transferase 1